MSAANVTRFVSAEGCSGNDELEFTLDSNASPLSSPPVAEATCLGRFRILEKLGEGGMGEVFKAEDPSDGTVVAIKVLSRRVLSNREAVRRFHKEARLFGQIKSPYVTNLLEVNEDNGQHFPGHGIRFRK